MYILLWDAVVFTNSKVTIPSGRKNDGKVIISNVEKVGILAKTEILHKSD